MHSDCRDKSLWSTSEDLVPEPHRRRRPRGTQRWRRRSAAARAPGSDSSPQASWPPQHPVRPTHPYPPPAHPCRRDPIGGISVVGSDCVTALLDLTRWSHAKESISRGARFAWQSFKCSLRLCGENMISTCEACNRFG
jgi:hypothetical protein